MAGGSRRNFLLYAMIDDGNVVELASEIIGIPGVSIASLGRGSLASSLGGDPSPSGLQFRRWSKRVRGTTFPVPRCRTLTMLRRSWSRVSDSSF